jgi:hypothetical protein
MAGGYKMFGPTYNSTPYLRLGYEGTIDGLHDVDVVAAQAVNGELTGKIAAMGANGVTLAGAGGAGAVGLFREDLGDMINASAKASFYMRGGEYFVAESRLGAAIGAFTPGMDLTSDAHGKLVPAAVGDKVLATVTYTGVWTNGNMYQWAGAAANGGLFLGFILHI